MICKIILYNIRQIEHIYIYIYMAISIYRDRELHVSCKWKSCGVLYWCFLTTAVLGQPILLLILNSQAIYLYIHIYFYFLYIYKLYYIYIILNYIHILLYSFQQTRYCLCHYLWRIFSTQRTVQNGSQPFI